MTALLTVVRVMMLLLLGRVGVAKVHIFVRWCLIDKVRGVVGFVGALGRWVVICRVVGCKRYAGVMVYGRVGGRREVVRLGEVA